MQLYSQAALVDILAKPVARVTGVETEADSILLVYPNAPESVETPDQLLTLITRTSEVIKTPSRIQGVNLFLAILGQSSRPIRLAGLEAMPL